MLGLATYTPATPYPRMAMKPSPDRLTPQQIIGRALRRLRKRARLTQEEAAERCGVVVQSWRRYEAGSRDLSLEKITELVEAMGFTLPDFLREREAASVGAEILGAEPPAASGSPAPRSFLMPIRDRVQAGVWLEAEDDQVQASRTYPEAPDPRFARAHQWLSEVGGDSMDLLRIYDGDLIKVVDAVDIGYAPRTGDIVEVERLRHGRSERELTVKQVEVVPGGLLLWPRSSNPRHQQPLDLREGAAEHEELEWRVRGLVISVIRRLL